MPINYNLTPTYPQRITGQFGSSLMQLDAFPNVYRGLRDFIDNGGLTAFGYPETDIARWNSEFRPGVVWVGGQPSELNFFQDLWGTGVPKEIGASDLYISYNSAINYNIFAENSATGTTGTVTGAYFGSTSNGTYSGAYAQFQIATSQYMDNGNASNIFVGDEIFIYGDARWVKVIKVDTTTPYAYQVYVAPKDGNYTINIPAKQAMLPVHVQETSGYFDDSVNQYHTEWETPGYVKRVQPLMEKRDYATPRNLGRAWQDVYTFPLIFDTNTGQTLDSFDLKASQGAREDMVIAENLKFFTGEPVTNPSLLAANYTQQYNGFEGYMNELWYGGGQVDQFDPSLGWDLDTDWKQLVLQTDSLKLAKEYLMMCSVAFKFSMESRAQDMFLNNSGSLSFETFKRGALSALDSTQITRMGINSINWGGFSLFVKVAGAWSDSRWIGPYGSLFANMAILMPGYGQVDSNGMATPPVEFWRPTGTTQMAGWNEILRDMWKIDNSDQWKGSITNTLMMSVNGIENVFGIMPNQ